MIGKTPWLSSTRAVRLTPAAVAVVMGIAAIAASLETAWRAGQADPPEAMRAG